MKFKKAPKRCQYKPWLTCDYDKIQTDGKCMEPTCSRSPHFRHQLDFSCDFMINAIDQPMEVEE